jgi:glucose-1-phosphate adenylyltransferase
MGCDYYEIPDPSGRQASSGLPPIGIGRNARIENAIIDRNARIGDNVVLSPAGKPEYLDHEHCYIRDGIVIVPRNGVIPHGMVL